MIPTARASELLDLIVNGHETYIPKAFKNGMLYWKETNPRGFVRSFDCQRVDSSSFDGFADFDCVDTRKRDPVTFATVRVVDGEQFPMERRLACNYVASMFGDLLYAAGLTPFDLDQKSEAANQLTTTD